MIKESGENLNSEGEEQEPFKIIKELPVQEEELKLESPEEKVEIALEKQDAQLSFREGNRDKNTLSGLKKWLGVATVMGASLLAVGCNAEKSYTPLTTEQKIEKIEKQNDQLFKDLENCGCAIDSVGNNTLIELHGKFYELDLDVIEKLTEISSHYTDEIHRTHSKDRDIDRNVKINNMNLKLAKLKEAIVKYGREISEDRLTSDFLKRIKEEKIKVSKEMQEGSVVQPGNNVEQGPSGRVSNPEDL